MDTIFLRDLRIETVIGIFDWERCIRQTVSIDLEMDADIRRAAATDSIEDTLNYKAVAKRLIQFVGDAEFGLIETLAEQVARIVVREFGVSRVRVVLHKPGAVRGAKDVGVIIVRGQDDYDD
jgi:dihydroneopterin aldolase